MAEHKILEYLQQLGIPVTTYEHEAAFTCEAMERITAHLPPIEHCKNLFLKDKRKRYWLLSALYGTKVELKVLAKQLDAPDLRFARPDELEAVLGVKPGSVTLFALINDTEHRVNVLLDKNLMEKPTVGFHPLRNDMTTVIATQDVTKFLDSLGYAPILV